MMVSDKVQYCIIFNLDSEEDVYLVDKGSLLKCYQNHELPKNATIIDIETTQEVGDVVAAIAGLYKNANMLGQKLKGVCGVVREIESKRSTAQNLADYLEGERGKRLTELIKPCIKTSPQLDENSMEEY